MAPATETDQYAIEDSGEMITPALVVFAELVERNLDTMVRIAGNPDRLRPHCKTHKMREIVRMQLDRGITKQKCATFAEAEMVVEAGVEDVLLAYSLVGPNVRRAVAFRQKFPQVKFGVTADHPRHVEPLGEQMAEAGLTIDVLLDLDTGQHRTGLPPGDEAVQLYQRIADTPGLNAAGLHLYDGQNHQTDLAERRQAVQGVWSAGDLVRKQLEEAGLAVPQIVAGGSGSFPIFAEIDDPAIQLSPGTVIFFDRGYGQMFPDLDFVPAALLLTRVISRPTPDRVTLDLGYKAVASDPPAGRRLFFPALPEAREVLQNEEHLVLETEHAERFQPGDELLAIPRHICPTSALHKEVFVVRDRRLQETWSVAARDRWLTV